MSRLFVRFLFRSFLRLFVCVFLEPAHVHLRHQLIVDDREEGVQLVHLLFGEALLTALLDLVQIVQADLVVVVELLRGTQVIGPLVLPGLDLLHISLPDQARDLGGRIRGGEAAHVCKLRHRGLTQLVDDLHAEGLHGGQGCLPALKVLCRLHVEVQPELTVKIVQCLRKHVPSRNCFLYYSPSRRF